MLSNFNSFYEIFAALNLAYAGSDNFRYSIDNIVDKFIDKGILPSLKTQVELLRSKIVVLMAEPHSSAPQVMTKIAALEKQLENACKISSDSESYTNGFKSMFLITFFYCVALVTLGGYELGWETASESAEADKTINLFLVFSWPIVIFNLIVFYRSFTRKRVENIKPIYTLGIITGLFGLAFWALHVCPYVIEIESYFEKKTCITSTLFVAVSPYILHVLRALIGNLFIRLRILLIAYHFRRYLNKVSKALDTLFNK